MWWTPFFLQKKIFYWSITVKNVILKAPSWDRRGEEDCDWSMRRGSEELVVIRGLIVKVCSSFVAGRECCHHSPIRSWHKTLKKIVTGWFTVIIKQINSEHEQQVAGWVPGWGSIADEDTEKKCLVGKRDFQNWLKLLYCDLISSLF